MVNFLLLNINTNLTTLYTLSGIREIIFGKRTAEFPLPKSLNGKFDSLPPVEGLIFEFVFDFKARGQWKHWNDIIKNMEIEDLYNFQDVLVPTIDSSRYCHILGKCSNISNTVLLVEIAIVTRST